MASKSTAPKLAFTLDWAEAVRVLLECHVAVKGFCVALLFKCPFSFEKVITGISVII